MKDNDEFDSSASEYAVPSSVLKSCTRHDGVHTEGFDDNSTDEDNDDTNDFEHISSITMPVKEENTHIDTHLSSLHPEHRSPSQTGRKNQLITSAMLDDLLGSSDDDDEEAPPPPPRRSTVVINTQSHGLHPKDNPMFDEEAPPPPPRRLTAQDSGAKGTLMFRFHIVRHVQL